VENRFLEMQEELRAISARSGRASGDGLRSVTISTDDSSLSQSTSTGKATTVVHAHSLSDDAGAGNAMTVSDAGVEFVKGWEGFAPKLYNDAVGHCTVGYGTLVHLGNCDGRDSEQPYLNGVSQEAATRLLESALAERQSAVSNAVKVTLNQNQYDALASFAYNVGSASFQKSTLLRLLNQGKYDDVPGELKKWTKVRKDGQLIDLPGLVKRRAGEAALFMRPAAASVAQSTWSLQQDAIVSPFPPRFADPLAKDDKKLSDSFKAALKAVKDNPDFAGLPGIDELPIILVPLKADKTRPFVGLRAAEEFYAGSMLKIAAMFAAFQLRHAVNQLTATLDSAKITDQGKLFAAVRKAFDDLILKASDLIRKAGTTGNRAPQYDRIFTAAQDGAGKWSVKFRADADPKLDFDGHLKNMIVNSHNPSAGFCIQALGFSWIDGLLQKVGLFSANRGIWLAGDYLDQGQHRCRARRSGRRRRPEGGIRSRNQRMERGPNSQQERRAFQAGHHLYRCGAPARLAVRRQAGRHHRSGRYRQRRHAVSAGAGGDRSRCPQHRWQIPDRSGPLCGPAKQDWGGDARQLGQLQPGSSHQPHQRVRPLRIDDRAAGGSPTAQVRGRLARRQGRGQRWFQANCPHPGSHRENHGWLLMIAAVDERSHADGPGFETCRKPQAD
jgi:GH24 family phage-related lysozyme (muramidase)